MVHKEVRTEDANIKNPFPFPEETRARDRTRARRSRVPTFPIDLYRILVITTPINLPLVGVENAS